MEVVVRSENVEILLRLRDRLGDLTHGVSRRWAPMVEEALRLRTPVRTGRLREEIRVEPSHEGLRIIGPRYLLYLITGTRPHEILPLRARALRFEVEGGIVYARRVRHPGLPPHPFLRLAMDEAIGILPEVVSEVLRYAARG